MENNYADSYIYIEVTHYYHPISYCSIVFLRELRTAMESLGNKHKNKMVTQMIENMKEGEITFDDFLDMMTARISDTDSKDDIRKVFRLFVDDDKDYITIKNLERVARELGETMSQQELEEMIQRADTDNDQRISFEEFYTIMTKRTFD
jgi:Ca2+-binding EF-hand superfamily protein